MNIMIATCFRTVAPPCCMGEREGKRARSTSLIVICVRFRPHFVRPCLRPSVRQAGSRSGGGCRQARWAGGQKMCREILASRRQCGADAESESEWLLALSHSLPLSPLSLLPLPLSLPLRMRSRFHSRSWPSVASPTGRKRRGRIFITTPLHCLRNTARKQLTLGIE